MQVQEAELVQFNDLMNKIQKMKTCRRSQADKSQNQMRRRSLSRSRQESEVQQKQGRATETKQRSKITKKRPSSRNYVSVQLNCNRNAFLREM